MSLKHLTKGSAMPPLKNGLLRIYSMAYCPYAQRARLVLDAKNIPHEIVNIKLRGGQPEWFATLNPTNTVPTIQLDDKHTLYDSLIVSEFLDDAYPENKLKPSDPYLAAQNKLALEAFSKVLQAYFKAITKDPGAQEAYDNTLPEFLKYLKDDYLGGKKPSFADYMVWPWMERIEVPKRLANIKFDQATENKLNAYIQRMLTQPGIKKNVMPIEKHLNFFTGYMTDPATFNYDSYLD